jgi:hypothetical protein
MVHDTQIQYLGWSTLSIQASNGVLFFDPFFRKFCGAQWFTLDDLGDPDVICITHGHEEHFRDCPEAIKRSGAQAVATKSICDYMRWRNGVRPNQLNPISFRDPLEINGFRISAFPWKHRDINVFASVLQAVFQGNGTKLAWAWSSFINGPFYSAFSGFNVELPNGLKILNYNEGFNTKMTDKEITELGSRFQPDVLLAGMQMHYTEDVARGAAALKPKIVLLYQPHEHFHKMMGATWAPWEDFAKAVQDRLPDSVVVIATPGMTIDAATGEVLEPRAPTIAAA